MPKACGFTARGGTEAVSVADAATLPAAAATAYDGIIQLALARGETLLITGVGGRVGVAAAQLAVQAGLRTIGTASSGKVTSR